MRKPDPLSPYWDNQPFAQGTRLLTLGGAVVAAIIAGVMFIPGVGDQLAPVLGDARNAFVFGTSSVFLAIFCLVALWLGRVNAHRPNVSPKYAEPSFPIGQFQEHLPGLSVEKILEEEMEYAGRTADQAQEHRMAIVNFYLLIIGGVGTGVVSLVSANTKVAVAAVPLLWLLAVVGSVLLLQLIALRRSWFDSVLSMNYIKEFFVLNAANFNKSQINSAFLWKAETIPPPHKTGNIYYYSALLMALLNTGAFFGGIYLLGLYQQAVLITPGSFSLAFVLATIFFVTHLFTFHMMLIPLPRLIKDRNEYNKRLAQKAENDKMKKAQATPVPATHHAASVALQSTNFPGGAAPHNTITGTKRIFDGHVVHLRVDDIQLPDGSPAKREIVEHVPAVVIIPYQPESGEVLLVQQYRDAVQQMLWEVPAGLIDPGETPEQAAIRELREETGHVAQTLVGLGTYFTSPGFTDERHHLFLALGLTAEGQIQDPNEIAHTQWRPLTTILEQVDRGEIVDSKTIIGVLRLARQAPAQV